jgi:hypothetical protein
MRFGTREEGRFAVEGRAPLRLQRLLCSCRLRQQRRFALALRSLRHAHPLQQRGAFRRSFHGAFFCVCLRHDSFVERHLNGAALGVRPRVRFHRLARKRV